MSQYTEQPRALYTTTRKNSIQKKLMFNWRNHLIRTANVLNKKPTIINKSSITHRWSDIADHSNSAKGLAGIKILSPYRNWRVKYLKCNLIYGFGRVRIRWGTQTFTPRSTWSNVTNNLYKASIVLSYITLALKKIVSSWPLLMNGWRAEPKRMGDRPDLRH